MTELREKINNMVEDYQECLVLAKSVETPEVYEGTTATAEDIAEGKTAYSNGERIVGTMKENTNNAHFNFSNYTPTSTTFTFTLAIKSSAVELNLESLNFSGYTAMDRAFSEYSNLEKITGISGTSNVTSMQQFFYNCSKLKEVPYFDTSKNSNFSAMFSGCKLLETIPVYSTASLDKMAINNCFTNCSKLSDESLNNILTMCINAKEKSSLKAFGLTSAQATRCQSLSNYQAFLNAGWTTGY